MSNPKDRAKLTQGHRALKSVHLSVCPSAHTVSPWAENQ